MKPVHLTAGGYVFSLEDRYFRLDTLPLDCPEETGFTGTLPDVRSRVELARFLRTVADTLDHGVTDATLAKGGGR